MAVVIPAADRASANLASGTTLTINKPSNVADGDLFIASVHYSITSGSISTPSGWTQEYTQNTSRTYAIYTKPIPSAAGETATDYAFNMTGGAGRLIGTIFRATGADASDASDAVGTMVTTGSGSTVAPSVTAVGSACLLFGVYWTCDSAVTSAITVPGTMTQLNHSTVAPGSTTTLAHCYEQLSASGATGTRTATNSPGASSGVGGLLMTLLPAEETYTVIAAPRMFPSLAATQAATW